MWGNTICPNFTHTTEHWEEASTDTKASTYKAYKSIIIEPLRINQYNESLLLLTGLCQSIICLQETFKKLSDNLDIRGYTVYNHIHQSGDRASGGSSIVVNNSISQSQIHLNTNIQAVAVRVTLHKTIHACSIYLPPGDHFNISDLEHLLAQLPKPFIIMGDFNSHSNL